MAVGQDTPNRPSPKAALDGFGVDWTVQVAPFQCSARFRVFWPGGSCWPTAVQLVAEAHDTESSSFSADGLWPAGSGVGSMVQVWPFQCSARVKPTSWELPLSPTAVQLDGAGHEMPVSSAPACRPVCGMGWTVQVAPFQCSASGQFWPWL